MSNLLKESLIHSSSVIAAIFTFFPESFFGKFKFIVVDYIANKEFISHFFTSSELNIVFNRILCCLLICFLIYVCYQIYFTFRRSITIKEKDFEIQVSYGNLLKQKNCKRVISFDECFTTRVGNGVGDIKSNSLCGQYLEENPNLDIDKLISAVHLIPEVRKSKYLRKVRYKSGSLVPYENDLLLAFAPLDENGRGVFSSYKDYTDSLTVLWKELDKYYAQHNVCIPILGSGITRIGDGLGHSFSQQELLSIMIGSYKISPYKIKKPFKLRIICRKQSDFTLENIKY